MLSEEMPKTFAFAVKLLYSSLKLQASLVHPGVDACGIISLDGVWFSSALIHADTQQ